MSLMSVGTHRLVTVFGGKVYKILVEIFFSCENINKENSTHASKSKFQNLFIATSSELVCVTRRVEMITIKR